MTFAQFLAFLTLNEKGAMANSADGGVRLFWMQAISGDNIDASDPATVAALGVFMTASRIAALQAYTPPASTVPSDQVALLVKAGLLPTQAAAIVSTIQVMTK